jgi:hypothetical protein
VTTPCTSFRSPATTFTRPTPRLTTLQTSLGPYLKVGMVVDRPGQEEDPDPVTVLAVVDSGAHRSIFPLQIATDLGIQVNELLEDPNGGLGVGSAFRLWVSTVSVRAGVGLFELDADGHDQPWGPGFSFHPAFTEHDVFLLGRDDFFRVFTISFDHSEDGAARFHLDYGEPANVDEHA